jgi:hypothetical protein
MTREAFKRRRAKFLPGGIPRWMRIYDNGGATCDRYTVVFTGRYTGRTGGEYWVLGMSGAPFWPQGFCQHAGYGEVVDTVRHRPGKPTLHGQWPPSIGHKCHLGTRIRFQDLPADCQKAARMDYEYLWDLTTAVHPSGSQDGPPVVIVPLHRGRRAT